MKTLLLVVSNDQTTISACEHVLAADYQLKIARTGKEGVKLYEDHLLEVQMVILDTDIQDMTAPNWIGQITSHYPLPYTILVASDKFPYAMIESMKGGAMDILRKNPLSESELVLAVKQGFDYRNMTLYLSRAAEQSKNQTIRSRLDAFLNFVHARKKEGLVVSPNEIALYFPAGNLEAELPLETVIEAIETERSHTLVKKWKEKPCLLAVDDEEDIRKTLTLELNRDFDLILASSCEDALEKIKDKPVLDVAVLDVGLPGMSGDDFVPILKEKYPNIQIMMLTGYSEHRLISKSFNGGAGEYMVKPVDGDALRQKLFALLQVGILNHVLSTYMKADH